MKLFSNANSITFEKKKDDRLFDLYMNGKPFSFKKILDSGGHKLSNKVATNGISNMEYV